MADLELIEITERDRLGKEATAYIDVYIDIALEAARAALGKDKG